MLVCPTAGIISFSGSYGWNLCGTKSWTRSGSVWIGNGFGYYADQSCTPTGNNVVLSEVTEPANTILVTDPASNGYAGNGLYAVGSSDISFIPVLHGGKVGPFTGAGYTTGGTPPTTAGGDYLFADGHVKWVHASRSWRSAMWNVDKSVTTGVQQP